MTLAGFAQRRSYIHIYIYIYISLSSHIQSKIVLIQSDLKWIIPTLKQRPLQSGLKWFSTLISSTLTNPLVCTDLLWFNSSGEDLTLFFRSRFLRHGQHWLRSSDGEHRGERRMAGRWFSQVSLLFFWKIHHRHWWFGFELYYIFCLKFQNPFTLCCKIHHMRLWDAWNTKNH